MARATEAAAWPAGWVLRAAFDAERTGCRGFKRRPRGRGGICARCHRHGLVHVAHFDAAAASLHGTDGAFVEAVAHVRNVRCAIAAVLAAKAGAVVQRRELEGGPQLRKMLLRASLRPSIARGVVRDEREAACVCAGRVMPKLPNECAATLDAALTHFRRDAHLDAAARASAEQLEAMISAVAACDDLLDRFAYAADLLGKDEISACVPGLHGRVAVDGLLVSPPLLAAVGKAAFRPLQAARGAPDDSALLLAGEEGPEDQLLEIWRSARQETALFFNLTELGAAYGRRLAAAGANLDLWAPAAAAHRSELDALHATHAPAVLARFRDAKRDFCASMYAFATPSPAALDAVVRLRRPIVEVGAGTGYWAALLRARGASVTAYDAEPPASAPRAGSRKRKRDAGFNAYHGRAKPWGPVLRAGAGDVAKAARWDARAPALMLCYAPPREGVAAEAIAAYVDALRARPGSSGAVVCVGEHAGLTGEAAAERLLERHFALRERLPLPQWGSTAAWLSIWASEPAEEGRGAVEGAPAARPGPSCVVCGTLGGDLRRCAFERTLLFCSAACAASAGGKAETRRRLALHGIELPEGAGGGIGWHGRRVSDLW